MKFEYIANNDEFVLLRYDSRKSKEDHKWENFLLLRIQGRKRDKNRYYISWNGLRFSENEAVNSLDEETLKWVSENLSVRRFYERESS